MSKMAQQAKRTSDLLLSLLDEYVDLCDLWEEHNRKAADKLFPPKAEKESHRYIQTKHMLPLMEKCSRLGFPYAIFLSIIPPAFATTAPQRQRMLESLREFAEEEFPA